LHEFEQKIKEYMVQNNVQGEHLTFEQSCHSVEAAAKAVNVTPEDLVKNICLVTGDGHLIVSIVKGGDRVSTKRSGKALGIAPPRIATPEEVMAKSGYPSGGVPSFGYKGQFLIDPKVMEKDFVYTGGGSPNSLIKISTKELQKVNKGLIVRIRK
jgi:Cys-tRNA(Pro)/Cys-tRNA(Cys) deacylase